MSTQPLLDEIDVARAIEVVRDIAGALHAYVPEEASARPLVRLRHAVFYAHLDRAGVLDAADTAEQHLEDGLRLMKEVPVNDRLHGGIAGIGWTFGRLVDADTADQLCDGIDQHLLEKLVPPWEGEFELLRGLVGVGVYALERQHRPTGQRLASRVLDHLEALAVRSARGTGWLTTPAMMQASNVATEQARAVRSRGFYNLGVSHGNAGVVGLLARYVESTIELERTTKLLEDAIGFLLSVSPPSTPVAVRFPHFLDPELQALAGDHRLAWCNGDLGIALVLCAAARSARRDDWAEEATRLAHQIAGRSFESSGVVDAGLCHGSAGVAHGLHRLFRATGDEICRDAARAWFRTTLALRRPGRGYGGYQVADRATSGTDDGALIWRDNATLLSGSVGIGLALLAAATGHEPDWDGVFMFDCGPWS